MSLDESKNENKSFDVTNEDSIKQKYLDLYTHLIQIDKHVKDLMPKLWYWMLVCLIDISLTIIIFWYAIYGDDRLDYDEMRSCDIFESFGQDKPQIFLVSRSCLGENSKISRSARISLFYCSWGFSTFLYMFTKRVNLDITFLEDRVLYLIYMIRSLSFFNALDYLSIMNDGKEFFRIYTVYFTTTSSNIIVFGSVVVSLLLAVIFYGTKTSFIYEDGKMNKIQQFVDFTINMITFCAIIFNLTLYLSIINTYEVSFTRFLDSRGPGLQYISFMTYGTVLLTIIEYHLFNGIKKLINDNSTNILKQEKRKINILKSIRRLLCHPCQYVCGDTYDSRKYI